MSDALVLVEGVEKSFGATRALVDCSFEIRAGEVHAVVGENGSGKSTLVKILSGVHAPARGTLRVGGRPMSLRTPRVAQRLGIATVFQEVLVAEGRSVLDNIWLGADGIFRSRASRAAKRRLATDIAEALFGHPLDLDASVDDLSLSERQVCCVVRAMVRRPRVLILDEATSALDVSTRDRLFEMVRARAQEGLGVLFVSHRMDEIEALGDRVTVMRSGRTVATLDQGSWTKPELLSLMTGGGDLVDEAVGSERTADRRTRDDVVLSVRNLRLRATAAPINLEIRSGEIVGLAGLEGHGQDKFMKALCGLASVTGDVVRISDGAELVVRGQRGAAALGIAYVARERRDESLFASMSIENNFSAATLDHDRRRGRIKRSLTRFRLGQYAAQMQLKWGAPGHLVTTLSGGNQQKLVIARWLATKPTVLLLNDPTRGIDITAKRDIYRLLHDLAQEGVAVVMLSTEVDEHVEFMDHVLVFREHEMHCRLERPSLSREALVASFFGEGESV
jgi:ABC-type sugar transport system ATPase subunit